ncbi:heterokaryon incompatibility protein-domain-containing protein [Xylariaceae sp. FL1272]|nr:heterokaryon incompatibility protein-domain-containing protein [Xylariaceae sp. FL1272]
MRLIHTGTRILHEFIGRKRPPYAILSHTWEEEEVSYKDYVSGNYRHLKGFSKIDQLCRLAASSNLDYVWVDTCCIDKSSSAELPEAINSMFAYYSRSQVCIAYLSDLAGDRVLESCRWFKRGWTLQELIAPRRVDFYDGAWNVLGDKASMASRLCRITGIEELVLLHRKSPSDICVAQRMSWAALRQTTRVEDEAYCLLGLFGINMPLLYGEENKAFRRLQYEIIRTTHDWSILAWTSPFPPEFRYSFPGDCGILAPRPSAFISAGSISSPQDTTFAGELTVGTIGLKVKSILQLHSRPGTPECRYILPLYCNSSGTAIAIPLCIFGESTFFRDEHAQLYKYKGPLQTYASRERTLLFEKPLAYKEGELYYHTNPKTLLRRHVLQVTLATEDAHLGEFWGCFDAQDQCFFTTSIYSPDFAALQFTISFPTSEFGEHAGGTSNLRGMLAAVNWASDTPHKTAYFLLDYHRYPLQLSLFQQSIQDMAKSNISSEQFFDKLWSLGMSVETAVATPVPNTEYSALVSLRHTVARDESICKSPFCRLVLSYELLKTTDVPKKLESNPAVSQQLIL